MTLDEARDHIGAGVVYLDGAGQRHDGEIVRVNEHYVFVLYGGDRTPKATPPGCLTLLARPTQTESLF